MPRRLRQVMIALIALNPLRCLLLASMVQMSNLEVCPPQSNVNPIPWVPFFLLMSEKAPTNYCSLEVVFLPQTGMVNPLLPWVFLNKCSLSFSEETRQITLEASMNKLWFALQILGWGGTTFLIIWLFLALGDNPRDNILLLFAGLVLLQPIMIWRRDIRRFKQIRSFAGKQK